jgi:hypothetical protein
MRKKYHRPILLFVSILLVAGCKKYLTVQPESSYTELQVYSSERAVQQALNGLYNDLADNQLYGANMTTTALELLGQRYNATSAGTYTYSQLQQYAYTQDSVEGIFNGIWQKAYGTILNANKFISMMDGTVKNGLLTQAHADQLKGEAIAIRAFLHFDMLRLFGPVYSQNPTRSAIPYYRRPDATTTPILIANQVLDSVLADLSQAETLLAGDPIISGGITFTQDFYAGYRNERMNYYAVKGLMARAYLWGGNPSAAHDSALQVLNQGEKWFPWLKDSLAKDVLGPDRIFSPEMLFGVYNANMYINYLAYFSPALLDNSILAAQSTRLANIFENNTNDYRYTTPVPAAGSWQTNGKSYPTFFKFADVSDPTKTWRFIQPLLRKSELYYIVAETDPNPTTSIALLDTVRYHRNVVPLTAAAVIPTEVQKEYQKEFWGEGQLFFYYKRNYKTSIPSGISGTGNISMSAVKYVVPLPLSETTPR